MSCSATFEISTSVRARMVRICNRSAKGSCLKWTAWFEDQYYAMLHEVITEKIELKASSGAKLIPRISLSAVTSSSFETARVDLTQSAEAWYAVSAVFLHQL